MRDQERITALLNEIQARFDELATLLPPYDDLDLDLPESDKPVQPQEPLFNTAAFFDEIRGSLFGGRLTQEQVEGTELIGEECIAAGLIPLVPQTAYVLATVYHETARTMQPIREWGGRKKRYAPWYGRGHVQLTWESNYRKQERKLAQMARVRQDKIPYRVHQDPELALHPETSAIICVRGMQDGDFTGKALRDYINGQQVDYVNARRIVNGTDRAKLIAKYAGDFELAIKVGLGAVDRNNGHV